MTSKANVPMLHLPALPTKIPSERFPKVGRLLIIQFSFSLTNILLQILLHESFVWTVEEDEVSVADTTTTEETIPTQCAVAEAT